MSKDKKAVFADVSAARNNKDILVVDVRPKDLVAKTGKIPFSINIPDTELKTVLETMSAEEFKKKFNRDKPTKETEIIFYCDSGKLSKLALDIATELGYANARNYESGYSDWECNEHKACSL